MTEINIEIKPNGKIELYKKLEHEAVFHDRDEIMGVMVKVLPRQMVYRIINKLYRKRMATNQNNQT